MTWLAAAKLILRPVAPVDWQQRSGVPVRAWLLDQMSDSLRAMAQPDDGRLPYTVSGLMNLPRGRVIHLHPEMTCAVRLTTLDDQLTDWLCSDLLPHLPGQIIRLHEAAFAVEQVILDAASDPSTGHLQDSNLIVDGALKPTLSRTITLDFESPTAFRRSSTTLAMPLPELVFGSLLRQWNRCNGIQLPPEVVTFTAECIAVKRHRLHSYMLFFDGSDYPPETGTTGWCQYVITTGDLYWRGVVHALAAYSLFAGVGIRTAVGMGQVRLHQTKENTLP